jgi:hypothetical protein
MLKIIIVLATTSLFAGMLVAHPYVSPSVDPAGEAARVATVAPAQAQPNQNVAVTERWPAPSKASVQQDAVAGPSGGSADTSGAVAARPQLEQAHMQIPRPSQDNRYAALNAGIAGNQSPMERPPFAPPTYGRARGQGNAFAGPRPNGRYRFPQPDATPGRMDPPWAKPGVVFNRPMPLEQRIYLAHNSRYYWQ